MIEIEQRFRGPPHSGNGGYVAGLLARLAGGHRAVLMRAPVPLDTPMRLDTDAEPARLMLADTLVAEARSADRAALPETPAPPTLDQARAAGADFTSFHPICVCCGDALTRDQGLGIRTGQLEGAPPGTLAGVWRVDPAFVGPDGLAPEEIVWAAIDCPGYYAWVALEGRHGALTGTMQAEVIDRPRVGDECIVMAWPWEHLSERRRTSGVALFAADGRLLARGYQVWVTTSRPPPAA